MSQTTRRPIPSASLLCTFNALHAHYQRRNAPSGRAAIEAYRLARAEIAATYHQLDIRRQGRDIVVRFSGEKTPAAIMSGGASWANERLADAVAAELALNLRFGHRNWA